MNQLQPNGTISLPSKFSHALITGTWDGARKQLKGAAVCEALKLYCQVMLGFELIAIKLQEGVTQGGDHKSSSKNQNLIPWTDRVEKELGIKYSTANLLENMARNHAAKLKKIPELKDFDVFATPISELSDSKIKLISASVKKATDGKTQAAFCEELNLWKKFKGAAGRKPGDGGRPAGPVSAEDVLNAKVKMGRENVAAAWNALSTLGTSWVPLPDADETSLQALLSVAETQVKALRLWLNTPAAQRDPKQIEQLLK